MDALDKKLNDIFGGKVVRKDLVHHIKKAANVPSFVLEFLLSKYCATDDESEIEAGKRAVLEVIENNYVRPDEANKAQSLVQQKGRHKFIDKIHVRYVESERRHWAEMENFGSRRIAINEKFYRENEKLLEGGIWAEVTLGHNDVEEDNYAFYIEDLKPIQLSRFSEKAFFEGRKHFTRDEWIDVILRSVGLNPDIMDNPPPEIKKQFPSGLRLKLHFLSRLIPLVQSNYNYIELGPRGTGKSYFYSEFSPYSTLLSGGQSSTATLLYNNARRKVGTVTALLKIIHPSGEPTSAELEDIIAYAVEGRRRVKEQMNKRKPDDEFALINLSYFTEQGEEVVVFCPESKNAAASQNPRKSEKTIVESVPLHTTIQTETTIPPSVKMPVLAEKRLKIHYGDVGYGYESLFKDYLKDATDITLEDPYIRQKHQISNFVRFCELVVRIGDCKKIHLITAADDESQRLENLYILEQLGNSLFDNNIELKISFNPLLHDRELKMSNGWHIRMGRGLDYFQSLSGNFFQIGVNDLDLRACLEANFDFYQVGKANEKTPINN